MGVYYNPPNKLPQVARRIEGSSFQELTDQLNEGEKLIGHYQQPLFQNAVWLFSEREYRAFKDAGVPFLGYYAMPHDEFVTGVRSDWESFLSE